MLSASRSLPVPTSTDARALRRRLDLAGLIQDDTGRLRQVVQEAAPVEQGGIEFHALEPLPLQQLGYLLRKPVPASRVNPDSCKEPSMSPTFWPFS